MKEKIVFKFVTFGVLLFYTLVIVGIGYGCYSCFNGMMLVVGIWQVVRIVGGILLALVDIIVFIIWLFIAIYLVRGLPEKDKKIAEEEAKQFEQFIKSIEVKEKK